MRTLSIAAVVLAVLGAIPAVYLEMGIRWDFANFYDAGRKVLAGEGENIYRAGVPIAGEPAQGELGYLGAPITAALFAPMGWLSPPAALRGFKAQNVLAWALGLFLLHRLLSRRIGDGRERARFTLTFAVAILLFQPFWTVFRVGGQTTPTVFVCFVIAGIAYTSERYLLASLCLVTAVSVKPAFAPALALLTLFSGPRFLRTVVPVGLAAAGLSILVMGWDLHVEFLENIRLATKSSVWWVWNSAVTVPLENLRLPSDPAPISSARPVVLTVCVWAAKLVVLGGTVWLWRLARARVTDARARRETAFLLALVFTLMFATVVWEHYLALLFIPLAYLFADRSRIPAGAFRIGVAIVLSCVLQNIVVIDFLRERVAVETVPALLFAGFVKATPLLLALWLGVRYREPILAARTPEAGT